MIYKIIRTDKFDEQLRNIIFYIADDSGSIDVALSYLDKIEKSISRLANFPESGSIPRFSTIRKQGYRVLVIEKHLVFYKISNDNEEKTVIIYTIVDGRMEYKNLI